MRIISHLEEYMEYASSEWKENYKFLFIYLFFLEIDGQQACTKAQEAVHHLTSFMSSREEISRLEIQLPTTSLRVGYLSTNIQ